MFEGIWNSMEPHFWVTFLLFFGEKVVQSREGERESSWWPDSLTDQPLTTTGEIVITRY